VACTSGDEGLGDREPDVFLSAAFAPTLICFCDTVKAKFDRLISLREYRLFSDATAFDRGSAKRPIARLNPF
jgi:hypothetical protein